MPYFKMCPEISLTVVLTVASLLLTTPPISSERILFLLPLSSKSMTNIFEPLAAGLAERGHHLTIVGPTYFKISNKNVSQHVPISTEDYVRDYPEPFKTRQENRLFSLSVPFLTKNCHRVFQNQEFRRIANQSFDLIIANIFFHDCFAGVMHKIGSPIVFVGSLPVPSHMSMEMFGNHFPPSIVPFVASGDIALKMSFVQRVKNFLYDLYYTVMLDFVWRPPMELINKQYMGDETPSILDVYQKQASLLLMNSHFALTGPRPLLPAVVEIGGIHCRPAKALPKDLEEFVAGGKKGFIMFSLGSIVKASHMPESVRLAFLKTFAKLEQRVIWKWEGDDLMKDLPKNVKLLKWLPQQDLLGHPNIQLFITHGGLLSTEEAVYNGVPVLGVPVFVDQDANMQQAENLGFGLKAEILNLTETKLEPLVRKILDDPRYMEKAKEISKIFRDQPESPLQRALFWTEYVLRHKGAYHLRSEAAMEFNALQYHCMDVILFLFAITILVLLFVYRVVKSLLFRVKILLLGSVKPSTKSPVVKCKKN